MNAFTKITLLTYFGLIMFAFGKFTWINADGAGVFVPHIGGYYVSFIDGGN
jgi:hypothetical protein